MWCAGRATSYAGAAVTAWREAGWVGGASLVHPAKAAAERRGRACPDPAPDLRVLADAITGKCSCPQGPRTSTKRADQLADWPTAPWAFAREQTPLIRGAVSASENSQQGPWGQERALQGAWSSQNTPWTPAALAQVPFAWRDLSWDADAVGIRAGAAAHGHRSSRARGCARGPASHGARIDRCCGTRSDRSARTSGSRSRRTTCGRG